MSRTLAIRFRIIVARFVRRLPESVAVDPSMVYFSRNSGLLRRRSRAASVPSSHSSDYLYFADHYPATSSPLSSSSLQLTHTIHRHHDQQKARLHALCAQETYVCSLESHFSLSRTDYVVADSVKCEDSDPPRPACIRCATEGVSCERSLAAKRSRKACVAG